MYKIKNKNTGLFSKGGAYVTENKYHWSKRGKIWSVLHHVKLHASQYMNGKQNNIPDSWILCCYINNEWKELHLVKNLYP